MLHIIECVNGLFLTFMAPQACGDRKDTGLTVLASTGKCSRKLNSWASIRPCLSRIWGEVPRAVCNDLCGIDSFSIISTTTENSKKTLVEEVGKLRQASECEIATWRTAFRAAQFLRWKQLAQWQIIALCHQNQPPCQNQLSEQQPWSKGVRGNQ